jgi:hypothetical protein
VTELPFKTSLKDNKHNSTAFISLQVELLPRTFAKVSGKIIAMTPAVGFITQIMIRCMFSALNEKLDWNSNLNIYHKQACIRELIEVHVPYFPLR